MRQALRTSASASLLFQMAFIYCIARDCTAMLVQNRTAGTSRPDHLKNDPIAIQPPDQYGCLHD